MDRAAAKCETSFEANVSSSPKSPPAQDFFDEMALHSVGCPRIKELLKASVSDPRWRRTTANSLPALSDLVALSATVLSALNQCQRVLRRRATTGRADSDGSFPAEGTGSHPDALPCQENAEVTESCSGADPPCSMGTEKNESRPPRPHCTGTGRSPLFPSGEAIPASALEATLSLLSSQTILSVSQRLLAQTSLILRLLRNLCVEGQHTQNCLLELGAPSLFLANIHLIIEALSHLSATTCCCSFRARNRGKKDLVNGVPHHLGDSVSALEGSERAEGGTLEKESSGSAHVDHSSRSVHVDQAKDARAVTASLLQFLSNLCVKNRRTRTFVREKLCFHRLLLLGLTAPSIDSAFMLLSTLFQEDDRNADKSGEDGAPQRHTARSLGGDAAVEHTKITMPNGKSDRTSGRSSVSDGNADECAEQPTSVFFSRPACKDSSTEATAGPQGQHPTFDQPRFFESLTVLYAIAAQQADCTASGCCGENREQTHVGQALGAVPHADAESRQKTRMGLPLGSPAQARGIATQHETGESVNWARGQNNGERRPGGQMPGVFCPEWAVLFVIRMFQREPGERWFYRFFEHVQTRVSADTFEQCAILLLTPPTDAEEKAAEEVISLVLEDHKCSSENATERVQRCTVFEAVENIALQSSRTPADIHAYCARPCRAAFVQHLLRDKLSHTGRSTLLHFLLLVLEAVLDENVVLPSGSLGQLLRGTRGAAEDGGGCGKRAKLKEALSLSASFYSFVAHQVHIAIDGGMLLCKLQDHFLRSKEGCWDRCGFWQKLSGTCGTGLSDKQTLRLGSRAPSARVSRGSFFDFLFCVIEEGESDPDGQLLVPAESKATKAVTHFPCNTQPACSHGDSSPLLSFSASPSDDVLGDTATCASSLSCYPAPWNGSTSGSSQRAGAGNRKDSRSSTTGRTVSKERHARDAGVKDITAVAPPFDLLLVASQVRRWLSSVSPSVPLPASLHPELTESFDFGSAHSARTEVKDRQDQRQGALGSSADKEKLDVCTPDATVVKGSSATASIVDSTEGLLPGWSRVSGTFSALMRILAQVSAVSPLSECMTPKTNKRGQMSRGSRRAEQEQKRCSSCGQDGFSSCSPECESKQLLESSYPVSNLPAGSGHSGLRTNKMSAYGESLHSAPASSSNPGSPRSLHCVRGPAYIAGGKDVPETSQLCQSGEARSWNGSQPSAACPSSVANEGVQQEASRLARSLTVLLRFSQQRRLLALMWKARKKNSGQSKNDGSEELTRAYVGRESDRRRAKKLSISTGCSVPAPTPAAESADHSRACQSAEAEEASGRTYLFSVSDGSSPDNIPQPEYGDVEISTLLQSSIVNSVTIRGLASLLAFLPPGGKAVALLRRDAVPVVASFINLDPTDPVAREAAIFALRVLSDRRGQTGNADEPM